MFNYNLFLFKYLPSAWLCGVRVRDLNDKKCIITVKHNWFNSNPFKSLYWAVQGMASELATGLAIIDFANKNSLNISMLVISNESKFLKKALPLTLITAVLYLASIYSLNNFFELNNAIYKVIFIGLASLTFPHILLEYLIEKNEK